MRVSVCVARLRLLVRVALLLQAQLHEISDVKLLDLQRHSQLGLKVIRGEVSEVDLAHLLADVVCALEH